MKTVGAVMATYNGEKFLSEQLDSILLRQSDFSRLLLLMINHEIVPEKSFVNI